MNSFDRTQAILDELPEEKEKKKIEIQTLYAYDLFTKRNFDKAMREFTKLKTDPYDVIRLFPDLLPEDSRKSSMKSPSTLQLDGKDLELGLLALIKYLVEVRFTVQFEKQAKISPMKNSNELLQVIDTTLLKCYLQTNDSLVASVIRSNHCVLEESEKMLRRYQKYGELILLYQTKGHHKKALQFLQSKDVQESSLAGFERTIQYLQHLGNEHRQLIFEFSSWVIDKHPEDGLRIFTEDIPEVENLNRAEVLDFLLKSHQGLVTAYLEHVVHKWNEKKPIFHNILIQQYRKMIQELQNEIKSNPNGSDVK